MANDDLVALEEEARYRFCHQSDELEKQFDAQFVEGRCETVLSLRFGMSSLTMTTRPSYAAGTTTKFP